MRGIVFVVATAISLGGSAAVFAQGGYGGGGSGQSGFGGGGMSGGATSFGGGTSFSGGSSSFSGGTSFSGQTSISGGTSFSGTSFSGGTSFTGTSASGGAGATGGGIRGGAGGSGFTASTTNFESKAWNNPMWSGRPGSTNLSPKTPGGFGQVTLPATTSGTNVTNRTGRTGTATVGRGGTYSNGVTGAVGATPSPITYALEVRFPAPPIATSRLQTDLQSLVSRTSQLRQTGTVRVEVVGNTVILRGRVSDDDERRLVEGMVRLEPGVHEVQNEIEVASAPPKP
jgi:BON domain